jgi:hypothetical protein
MDGFIIDNEIHTSFFFIINNENCSLEYLMGKHTLVFENFLTFYAKRGDLCVDLCCGTATSLTVCLSHGIHFIGCDDDRAGMLKAAWGEPPQTRVWYDPSLPEMTFEQRADALTSFLQVDPAYHFPQLVEAAPGPQLSNQSLPHCQHFFYYQ